MPLIRVRLRVGTKFKMSLCYCYRSADWFLFVNPSAVYMLLLIVFKYPYTVDFKPLNVPIRIYYQNMKRCQLNRFVESFIFKLIYQLIVQISL